MKRKKLTTKTLLLKKKMISQLNHNNLNGGNVFVAPSGFDNCNSFNTCHICDSNSIGHICGKGTDSNMCTFATCDTGTCTCNNGTA